MRNNKNTILILYPAAGYGTFLDWALNWFTAQCDIEHVPFTATGSSHGWNGAVIDMPGVKHTMSSQTMGSYLQSNKDFFSARTHGSFRPQLKTLSADEYTEVYHHYIHTYSQYFKHIVVLNPNPKNFLLFLHNYCTKTHSTASYAEVVNLTEEQQVIDIGLPRSQQRSQIANWYNRWHWYLWQFYQPVPSPPNVINVSVNSLVYDFKSTLTTLFSQLGLECRRSKYLDQIHSTWISAQKFINRDSQCKRIVEATSSNINFIFCHLDLHLFDEAYIVRQLEIEHRLRLISNDVDILPTDTIQLRELFQSI